MSHARIPRRPLSREIDSLSSASSANLNSPQQAALFSNSSPSNSLESSNSDRRASRTANSVLSNSPVPNKRSKSGNLSGSANTSLETFGFHFVSKRESSFETCYASNMDYNAPNGFRKNGPNSASGSSSTNPKAPPISGTVAAGPKRLSIKNAKEKQSICSNWDTEWPKLEAAVRAIHECRAYGASASPSSVERERYHSYEELYRSVENLCTTKLEPMLYTRLHTLCEEYTMRIVSQLHREDLAHDRFLELVNNCWQSHCEKMALIRSIFLFLDRTYIMQNTSSAIDTIWDMGLKLFASHVLGDDRVRERTLDGSLLLIARERRGEDCLGGRQLLANVVRMLLELRLYAPLLEPCLLRDAETAYRAEGDRLVLGAGVDASDTAALDVPAYLRHVASRLDEETERLDSFLDASTRKPLIRIVEEHLLERHMRTLLSKGFDELLDAQSRGIDRMRDLSLIYSLLARVPDGLPLLCLHFANYIKRVGRTIVLTATTATPAVASAAAPASPGPSPSSPADAQRERDREMVPQLLALKDLVDRVAHECFQRNERFLLSTKESFEFFINERPNKPAEMLAKYVDAKLRAGNKEVSEEELDRLLDRIMILFRFLNGKDMFEAFYKKDLAKRLLLGKSASVDAEKLMLSKLKHECGAQFTLKLEGMFKDIEVSKDISAAFRQHLLCGASSETPPSSATAATAASPGGASDAAAVAVATPSERAVEASAPALVTAAEPIDMSVNVLTQGYWPSYPAITVRLPEQLHRQQELFSRFYLSKHSGRKLLFQPTLGHCTLRAQFAPCAEGRKELQVSLLQCLVLLLFNEPHPVSEPLSLAEIRSALGMAAAPSVEGDSSSSSSTASARERERQLEREIDGELQRTLQSLACGKTRVLLKEPKGKEIEERDRFVFNTAFRNRHYRIKINQVQMKETQEEQTSTEEQVFADRQYQVDAAIVRIMKMRKTLTHAALVAELFTQLKFPLKPADIKKRIESLIERDYMQRAKDSPNEYHYVA